MKRFKRTLHDGREVDVGRNHGVRKICACSRHKHAKCPHAWYFNFSWQGRSYRLSLDRYSGAHIETRADAEALADQLRARIRAGLFDTPAETAGETAARDGTLTFCAFAAE